MDYTTDTMPPAGIRPILYVPDGMAVDEARKVMGI